MTLPRFVAIALMLVSAGGVSSQDYPSKPIRFVTVSVGSDSDRVARLIAQGVSGPLGQQVIVDNRPTGIIPGEVVSKASPDGYTVLVVGSSFWTGPIFQKTPYDVIKDFSPITLVGSVPNLLVVHPSLPVKSVKELIALAKARPGELNYAAGATGGSAHLSAELFKAMTGVNILRIPFSSGSIRMAALLSGEVLMEFASPDAVAPHVKAGKLRALAVTSLQPSALVPGVPLVAAVVPGYESDSSNAMFAPAKTPDAIIKRLNSDVVQFLNSADAKERFLKAATEIIASTPDQLAARMKTTQAVIGKLIKDGGIKLE